MATVLFFIGQWQGGRTGSFSKTSSVQSLTLPAAVQTTTTEYYVVQDVKAKKCTIVDKKHVTTTEFTVLGNGFKTRTEAEGGMKIEKICTTER
jgi:hypothetical protein